VTKNKEVFQDQMSWEIAALSAGEHLWSVGPIGYYSFNAEQWREWAINCIDRLAAETAWLDDAVTASMQAIHAAMKDLDSGIEREVVESNLRAAYHQTKAILSNIEVATGEDK